MSLPRPAAGGESCHQDSFLYAAPCRGNMLLCGGQGAQQIEELCRYAAYRGSLSRLIAHGRPKKGAGKADGNL